MIFDQNLRYYLRGNEQFNNFGQWEVGCIDGRRVGNKIKYRLRKSKGFITIYLEVFYQNELEPNQQKSEYEILKIGYDASNEIWVD